MTPTLLCVGDLNLDVTITLRFPLAIGSDTAGHVQMHGGGSAANVAAWATKAGIATRFIGAVADDHTGDFLLNELTSHGVEVHPLHRRASRSRTIAAIVGHDGNRSLVSDQDTHIAPTLDDFEPTWLDNIDWLHLTGYTYITPHSRPLFRTLTHAARDRHIPYSIDPSAAHLLATNCDHAAVIDAFTGPHILFPSHDEAEYLTGITDPRRAAHQLLDLATCVAVTCGPDGAHIARRGQAPIHTPAHHTNTINTLGCGDAFAAGFLAATLQGNDDHTAATTAIELATAATRLPAGR